MEPWNEMVRELVYIGVDRVANRQSIKRCVNRDAKRPIWHRWHQQGDYISIVIDEIADSLVYAEHAA